MSGKSTGQLFQTMIAKHGSEAAARQWFMKIGAIGGSAKTTKPKGFASSHAHAMYAGSRGGTVSRLGIPLTDEQKRKVLRKLERNSAYQHLLEVHEQAKREREGQS